MLPAVRMHPAAPVAKTSARAPAGAPTDVPLPGLQLSISQSFRFERSLTRVPGRPKGLTERKPSLVGFGHGEARLASDRAKLLLSAPRTLFFSLQIVPKSFPISNLLAFQSLTSLFSYTSRLSGNTKNRSAFVFSNLLASFG